MSKSAAPATVEIPALAPVVKSVAAAYKKAESAQVAIGKAVRAAAESVKADQVDGFVSMLREALKGTLSDASLKVEASRIRKVLRAIIEGDITPSDTDTLRTMYEACPKAEDKGGAPKKGAGKRGDEKASADDAAPAKVDVTAEVSKLPAGAKMKLACNMIFGHCDAELEAAMDWASMNEAAFVRMVKAAITGERAEVAKATAPKQRKAA